MQNAKFNNHNWNTVHNYQIFSNFLGKSSQTKKKKGHFFSLFVCKNKNAFLLCLIFFLPPHCGRMRDFITTDIQLAFDWVTWCKCFTVSKKRIGKENSLLIISILHTLTGAFEVRAQSSSLSCHVLWISHNHSLSKPLN